jgi:hypothetical protein
VLRASSRDGIGIKHPQSAGANQRQPDIHLREVDSSVPRSSGFPAGQKLVLSRLAKGVRSRLHELVPGSFGNVMTRRDGRRLRALTTFVGGEVHGVVGSVLHGRRWIVYRAGRARQDRPRPAPGSGASRPTACRQHPLLLIGGLLADS